MIEEGFFSKKKEATETDIDDILGLKPGQGDLNSLYAAPSYESYILNFNSLPPAEVNKLFRNIEDEVAFLKYIDSRKSKIPNEDAILFAFLASRGPKELHALYEKQQLKPWQINVAIEHGVALESLYKHNKLSPLSIEKAVARGLALNYLYRYQPNFTKKHMKKIAPFLEKHFGQSVDLDKMEVYDRDETLLWSIDNKYKRKVTPNTRKYMLEDRVRELVRGRLLNELKKSKKNQAMIEYAIQLGFAIDQGEEAVFPWNKTKSPAYETWLLNQLRDPQHAEKGLVNFQEDGQDLEEYITKFDQLKKQKQISGVDINQLDFPQLKDLVEEKFSISVKAMERGEVDTSAKSGYELKIFKSASDAEEVARIGLSTRWCTKTVGVAESHLKKGAIYIIYKQNYPYAQLHVETNQYMDVNDSPIKPAMWQELRQNIPFLNQLVKKKKIYKGFTQEEIDIETKNQLKLVSDESEYKVYKTDENNNKIGHLLSLSGWWSGYSTKEFIGSIYLIEKNGIKYAILEIDKQFYMKIKNGRMDSETWQELRENIPYIDTLVKEKKIYQAYNFDELQEELKELVEFVSDEGGYKVYKIIDGNKVENILLLSKRWEASESFDLQEDGYLVYLNDDPYVYFDENYNSDKDGKSVTGDAWKNMRENNSFIDEAVIENEIYSAMKFDELKDYFKESDLKLIKISGSVKIYQIETEAALKTLDNMGYGSISTIRYDGYKKQNRFITVNDYPLAAYNDTYYTFYKPNDEEFEKDDLFNLLDKMGINITEEELIEKAMEKFVENSDYKKRDDGYWINYEKYDEFIDRNWEWQHDNESFGIKYKYLEGRSSDYPETLKAFAEEEGIEYEDEVELFHTIKDDYESEFIDYIRENDPDGVMDKISNNINKNMEREMIRTVGDRNYDQDNLPLVNDVEEIPGYESRKEEIEDNKDELFSDLADFIKELLGEKK